MAGVNARDFCPRCLLAEVPDGAALAESIRQAVEVLPEANRAGADVREARLAICRRCEHLAGGLCVLCGCYVEYRAAQLRRGCPDVPGRWPRVPTPIPEPN